MITTTTEDVAQKTCVNEAKPISQRLSLKVFVMYQFLPPSCYLYLQMFKFQPFDFKTSNQSMWSIACEGAVELFRDHSQAMALIDK